FIRPEDVRLQPVALSDILAAIMPIVDAEAQSHGVQVRTEVATNLPDLGADPAMLEQAFLNLAINACQAMPQGGTLRIAAAPTWHRNAPIEEASTNANANAGAPPPAAADPPARTTPRTPPAAAAPPLQRADRSDPAPGPTVPAEAPPPKTLQTTTNVEAAER